MSRCSCLPGFLAALFAITAACGRRDPPAPSTSSAKVTPTAAQSVAPRDPFLEVGPDQWKIRPAPSIELTPPPVAKWETVAFEVVVPSLGDLRVSIVNRASASEPLGPTIALQDEHHVFDGTMSVHPHRLIRVGVSFETWRGATPVLPTWLVKLVPIDAGAAYAGATLVVIDDQVAGASGGRSESRGPIPIEAAPMAGFDRSSNALGQAVIKKVGDEVGLTRWVWSPQLTPNGMINALEPAARIIGQQGPVAPQAYPHPTWLLRVRFTPAAKP